MKAFKKTASKKQRVSNRPTPEGRRAEKALQLAVDGVIEEHRRLGLPIAVMRNGKAVYVNVAEIVPAVNEPKARYRAKR